MGDDMRPRRRRVVSDLRNTEADQILLNMAKSIRQVYVDERTRWGQRTLGPQYEYTPPARYNGQEAHYFDGDGDPVEKAVKSEWLLLAEYFSLKKIEPATFISMVFTGWAARKRPPEPSHFRSDTALQNWQEIKHEAGERLENALANQMETTRRELLYMQNFLKISMENATATIINAQRFELSPLFRYCLARSMPGERFLALAKHWEIEAAAQFVRYAKYYKTYWSSILPPEFPKHARAIYKLIYEGRQHGEIRNHNSQAE